MTRFLTLIGSTIAKHMLALALPLLCAFSGASVCAQTVDIQDARVQPTVAGQTASSAFMKLTSRDGARLIAVSSPIAGVADVHEMKMDGNVMTMRTIQGGLDLPAGKTVELTPGGYHIMLMDLKRSLQNGTTVPLTLVFKDRSGVERKVDLAVPVASKAPVASMNMDMSDHMH